MGNYKLMADMNDFGDIKENFEHITDVLDSMRAQNAMSAGSTDKVLANINKSLETLANEENSDLIKVFLAELKRSLEERHNFVSSKFSEIEDSFKVIVDKTENQLQASEIKEVFDIIATNLNVFSKDFSSQKDLITQINLKIEELKEDDSQKRDILRNIAVLKVELEKFSNGFESIILNLNNNFRETAQALIKLDSSESLDGIKKDIENVFLSSNAILSTLQVIDRKNRELEEIITHVVTKEDFNLEREQVAKLITQNIQITDYISTLPKQNQVETLSEKVDTAVGVINAMKNMLNETGKQNQKLLTAQLDNLESKILNISTEEEFIGFRKELSDFSQEIIQSTNLMRGDLAETNTELKDLCTFLGSMDIKASFESFASLTKVTENNIKESISGLSGTVSKEIEKNKNLTKIDVAESTSKVNEKIELTKKELAEVSKSNLATILEHLQSVVSNVFSVKNALHVENLEIAEATDAKLVELKENLVASNNFIIQNSRENLENIVSSVEKVYQEITSVQENLTESSSSHTKNLGSGFSQLSKKIGELKEELNQNSQESFANILSIVEDFSQEISTIKTAVEQSSQENSAEINSFIEKLGENFVSLKEALNEDNKNNSTEVKQSVDGIIQTVKFLKNGLEQASVAGFTGVGSNIEELSEKLESIYENLNTKSESNLAMLVSLFEDLTKEFNAHKTFLSESAQINFETVSLYIQNLNKRIEETKTEFSGGLKENILEIQGAISALPETIKENQVVFENEKRALIEENSKSVEQLGEKIQSLVKGIISKDNPFKENLLGEFAELKSVIGEIKEDVAASNHSFGENVEILVNESLQGVEDSISQYSEKYSQSLLGLQNKLGQYFENIQSNAQENDLKLSNSLNEAAEIKSEVKSIIELLYELKEDSTLNDFATGISTKFEGILLNITQLEEIFSAKNKDSLQNVLAALEEKFKSVSADFKTHKNFVSTEINEILNELEEKTATLKTEIGLTGTDVLSSLTTKTEEIISSLYPISDSVEKLCSFDFEEFAEEIKDQIEESHSSINSVINDSLQGANSQQLSKISDEFELLNEKLESITEKIYSNKTDEFEELKSALNTITQSLDTVSTAVNDKIETEFFTENFTSIKHTVSSIKIQNSEAINLALKTLMEKIEELSLSNDGVGNVVIDAKEEIFEKLNLVKESLLEAGEEANSTALNEIIKSQGETKTTILEELQNSILSIKEDFHLSTKSLVKNTIENTTDSSREMVFEKLDALLEKLVNSQDITKTELLEEISQIQEATKIALLSEINKTLGETETIESSFEASRELVFERLEIIKNKFTSIQDESKAAILNESREIQAEAKTAILDELNKVQGEIKSALIDEILHAQDETKTAILDEINKNSDEADSLKSLIEEISHVQNETKTTILDEINKTVGESEATILEELGENINFIKEVMDSLSSDKSLDEEFSLKLANLQEFVKSTSDSLETKLSSAQEKYKTSTQSLLSEVKTSFYEKVDDSLDELRSFIEILENKNDISGVMDNLKSDVFDKFGEFSDSLEASIKSISVKGELDEVNKNLEESINNLFASIEEKFATSLNENEKVNGISEKTEEINRRIEELKKVVTDEITEKLDNFELNIDNKNQGFSTSLEEMKTSLEELKESYIDLSLNSNMEMSSALMSVQEKIDGMYETLNGLISRDALLESVGNTKTEINENLAKGVESIHEKLDILTARSSEELEANVREIKEVVLSQSGFIEKIERLEDLSQLEKLSKLDDLSSLEKLSELEGLSNIKNEIQSALNEFKEKLDSVPLNDTEDEEPSTNIEETLKGFKEDLFESLVEIFNQISFVEESEDIKDFIEEKTDEIKDVITSHLKESTYSFEPSDSSAEYGSIGDIKAFVDITKKELRESLKSSLGNNFNEIISSLDILHEKTGSVDYNCVNLVNEIKEIKNKLTSGVSSQSSADYSYTLQDVESDIAKIRLTLKEISQTKSGGSDFDQLGDLNKINDDITSLSTRTNKLLLNSDESYSTLKDNLSDFRNIIYQLEERIKYIDNTEKINAVDKKLDNVNKLMLSSVNSDKIFNQTFMYLAEWIDKADEKLATIEEKLSGVDEIKQSIAVVQKSMLKGYDLEMLFDKFSKKFDQQQEKINSLEATVEKLSKKTPAKSTKDTDLKTLVKEVLALTERPESKADAKLAKKVDSIDKQLATFGKSIEKITSYVD